MFIILHDTRTIAVNTEDTLFWINFASSFKQIDKVGLAESSGEDRFRINTTDWPSWLVRG